jgi:stress-induced-phosphoprotein 1
MPNTRAEAFKNEGNKFFKNGDYKSAIQKYAAAADIDPNVPAYWSNMAACYEKIADFDKMEEASRGCIKADKNFVKGYFRLATALKNKNDLEGCIKALESGLAVDSGNADLKRMKKDLTELQRGETVAAYLRKCEEQTANGDIAGAYKTLELASRLDAGNPDIERMMSRVKPKWDRMESQRRANLSGEEVHKERGDDAYKNAQFEGEFFFFHFSCIIYLMGVGYWARHVIVEEWEELFTPISMVLVGNCYRRHRFPFSNFSWVSC